MDFKKVLSKTKDFILIIGFIIIFKSIFGDENTLIGVATITGMLLFLGKDLTLEPVKNTFGLIIFNVMLGVFSYIAQNNMYLGIIFNFIAIFVTAFSLSYNLKSPAYLPFTLQYLFMLATPVTLERFPLRLLSLVVGAIAIMVTQMVANRNRIGKYGDKILGGVCTLLLNKIRGINNGEDTKSIDSQIINSLYSFKKLVYDKRKRNFYLTEEGRIKLNLAFSLNKLNLLIDDLKEEKDFKKIEEEIIIAIDNIKICFENKENLNNINKLFSEEDNYKKNIENITILKILDSINFIKKSLFELYGLEKSSYNLTKEKEEIPTNFNRLKIYKDDIKTDSLRFTFALRFAIGVVIGAFITDYFKLSEGRWIYYTIAALTQPQYEMSKQKGKDRLFATFVGIVIVGILFTLIKGETLRALIIMGAGYVSSYFKKYRYTTICTTISAVGSAALLGSIAVFSIARVYYVILGYIIALLLAKFVLPYRLKDANNDLVRRYKAAFIEMLKEIENLLQGKKNEHSIRNLVLASSLIEDKLITNNSNSENKELDLLIEDGRVVSLNIFELYEWIKENEIDKNNINRMIRDIEEEVNMLNKGETISEEELIKRLEKTHGIKDKVTLSNLIEIFSGLNKINNIKVEF